MSSEFELASQRQSPGNDCQAHNRGFSRSGCFDGANRFLQFSASVCCWRIDASTALKFHTEWTVARRGANVVSFGEESWHPEQAGFR